MWQLTRQAQGCERLCGHTQHCWHAQSCMARQRLCDGMHRYRQPNRCLLHHWLDLITNQANPLQNTWWSMPASVIAHLRQWRAHRRNRWSPPPARGSGSGGSGPGSCSARSTAAPAPCPAPRRCRCCWCSHSPPPAHGRRRCLRMHGNVLSLSQQLSKVSKCQHSAQRCHFTAK